MLINMHDDLFVFQTQVTIFHDACNASYSLQQEHFLVVHSTNAIASCTLQTVYSIRF